MRRITMGLLAGCLLATGASPALAQESSPDPIGLGERVEVADAGYALTAPDGWLTILPSAEDAGAIIEAFRDIDPALAETTETALASGVEFSLLMFGATDAESGFWENCNVIGSASDGESLESILARDEEGASALGDRLASGPDATMLDLAVGAVARLDYGLQYPGLETAHAAYYFTDGSTFHLMTCTHVERAEDDWLSIAETFEFLPAEE